MDQGCQKRRGKTIVYLYPYIDLDSLKSKLDDNNDNGDNINKFSALSDDSLVY